MPDGIRNEFVFLFAFFSFENHMICIGQSILIDFFCCFSFVCLCMFSFHFCCCFALHCDRNEVNDKNPDSGPRRSLQRSATLPANPRNNPILRHHQRYHQDEPNPQIPIIVQPSHFPPQLHQKVRIRVRSTSTDKAGEINNNQNHVSVRSN